jgi:hypothetical protein
MDAETGFTVAVGVVREKAHLSIYTTNISKIPFPFCSLSSRLI